MTRYSGFIVGELICEFSTSRKSSLSPSCLALIRSSSGTSEPFGASISTRPSSGTEFSPYTTRFRGQMGKAEGGLHLTALITLVCRHFCRYVHRIFFLMVESIFVARVRFCGHAAHVAGS